MPVGEGVVRRWVLGMPLVAGLPAPIMGLGVTGRTHGGVVGRVDVDWTKVAIFDCLIKPVDVDGAFDFDHFSARGFSNVNVCFANRVYIYHDDANGWSLSNYTR